ncbi:RING-H2 finger protein ATL56-like [Venturia canescens]|uniref:RING-H2 finger protein ATL56-like n=1 Tax=Venturia canescens TaxID=32260 RepID=UPI001C9D42BE|nr:RING-H2 finger protein ATL56-like [Venturia canescens]
MPHPGVALMVLVSLGLGACLYYMFADSNTHHERQYQYGGGGYRSRRSESPEPLSTNQEERFTRKRGSTASNGQSDCTICLGHIGQRESIRLFLCRHVFHTTCITRWREEGPSETRDTCPNCRAKPKEW